VQDCGFGNVERLRKAFQRRFRITPQDYRRRFRVSAAD
jgi:transcriptional regulator GlxA family with amidase domain